MYVFWKYILPRCLNSLLTEFYLKHAVIVETMTSKANYKTDTNLNIKIFKDYFTNFLKCSQFYLT